MMSDADKVWTPSEIRLRYERGERNFRGLDIDDTGDSSSFREAVLDDADFTQCFVVADFSRASLRGCRFTPSNVKTCEFDNADLRSARLEGANFAGAQQHGLRLGPGELSR